MPGLLKEGWRKSAGFTDGLVSRFTTCRQLILHQNKENANIPPFPEGTNLLLQKASRGSLLSMMFFAGCG